MTFTLLAPRPVRVTTASHVLVAAWLDWIIGWFCQCLLFSHLKRITFNGPD